VLICCGEDNSHQGYEPEVAILRISFYYLLRA